MEKIEIIVADDHNLVREGFCSLLKQNTDYHVIAEAKNGEEVLELLTKLKPQILLLDLTMPKLSGMDVLAIIQEQYPDIKTIILTMHEETQYATKCIQKGAKGYLLKNTEPTELYQAINTVSAGGAYYTPNISNVLLSNLALNKTPNELLSEREKEILKLVIKGLSAKMVGDTLSISARTVENHKVNIMKKLKVNNTAELVSKAINEKLV
jgi:DNA-binding NarL/FixJ family response regulator